MEKPKFSDSIQYHKVECDINATFDIEKQATCDIQTQASLKSCAKFLISCLIVVFLLFSSAYWVSRFKIRSVLSIELVFKTSDPNKLQKDLANITATYENYRNLSSATAKYLLEVPDLYFSARTSSSNGIRQSNNWNKYYESLACQKKEQFFVMNINNNRTGDQRAEDNVKYVVLELIVVVDWIYELPTVDTFKDVFEALRIIKSISTDDSVAFLAADFFWTHPLKDIKDIPSLNLIHLTST